MPDQEKVGFYGWGMGAQVAFKIFLQDPKIRTGAFVQMSPLHETSLKTQTLRRMLFVMADKAAPILRQAVDSFFKKHLTFEDFRKERVK